MNSRLKLLFIMSAGILLPGCNSCTPNGNIVENDRMHGMTEQIETELFATDDKVIIPNYDLENEFVPEEKKFKYLFFSNGVMIGFYPNGQVVGCPRCEPDENGSYDFMFSRAPHTTYREQEDELVMEDGSKLQLFSNGQIMPDWLIFNYRPVEYLSAITSFLPYNEQIESDEVFRINETTLITIYPKVEEFDDEESEEAQDYYTAIDDLMYYLYETRSRFETLGVSSVSPAKRYLQMEIEENEQILLDTYASQNGWATHALIYRKGFTPLVVDIVENDMTAYKSYLGLIE